MKKNTVNRTVAAAKAAASALVHDPDMILHISSYTGKLADMHGTTTWTGDNEFCRKMAEDPNTVCSHCYAMQVEYRASFVEYARNNAKILTQDSLERWQVPPINDRIFRFETHGELINLNHLKNYIQICKWNKGTEFTLWTKRVDILRQAIKAGIKPPKNLHVKLSSPFVGRPHTELTKKWLKENGWNVTLFTVESLETLQEKYTLEELQRDSTITCGGRCCLACQKCYGRHPYEDVVELLKQDTRKAIKLGLDITGNNDLPF